jgi:hypothetical protein
MVKLGAATAGEGLGDGDGMGDAIARPGLGDGTAAAGRGLGEGLVTACAALGVGAGACGLEQPPDIATSASARRAARSLPGGDPCRRPKTHRRPSRYA